MTFAQGGGFVAVVILDGDVAGDAGIFLPGAGVDGAGGFFLIEVEQGGVLVFDQRPLVGVVVVFEASTAIEDGDDFRPPIGPKNLVF